MPPPKVPKENKLCESSEGANKNIYVFGVDKVTEVFVDVDCSVSQDTNFAKMNINRQPNNLKIKRKIFTCPGGEQKTALLSNKTVDSTQTTYGKFGKMDVEHFKNKNKVIEVNTSDIPRPIQCSTPTPSESTIMAGSISSDDEEENENNTEKIEKAFNTHAMDRPVMTKETLTEERKRKANGNEETTEVKKSKDNLVKKQNNLVAEGKHIKIGEEQKTKKAEESNLEGLHNNTYCEDWIGQNSRISVKNDEQPPSIYDTSSDSDSSFNLTSVSGHPYRKRLFETEERRPNNTQGMSREKKELGNNICSSINSGDNSVRSSSSSSTSAKTHSSRIRPIPQTPFK